MISERVARLRQRSLDAVVRTSWSMLTREQQHALAPLCMFAGGFTQDAAGVWADLPTGKQNSFASRAYSSYILAEKGDQQPRSLSVAFLKPVRGEDILAKAISEIEAKRAAMEKVYGSCADVAKTMNAETGEGSLQEIISFVKE